MTQTIIEPTPVEAGETGIIHIYWPENPNLALCGQDITDLEDLGEVDFPEDECIVCADLEWSSNDDS